MENVGSGFLMEHYQWICTQIGAREGYAVPRSFYRRKQLVRLYTDFWSGSKFLRNLSGRFRWPLINGLSRRYHQELPNNLVVGFNTHMVINEIRFKMSPRTASDSEELFQYWVREGREFASQIRDHLRRHKPPGNGPFALYAYSYGAGELLEYAREVGLFAVLNQIDPAMADQHAIADERRKWPGWEPDLESFPEAYFDRVRAEWAAANLIVVNSEWSKQALVGDGVPPEKIVIIPLAYEPEPGITARLRDNPDRPLHVLWIGQIILRKGLPYLLEAAKRLPSVRFTIAGRIGVNEKILRDAPKNVQIPGKVSRSEMHRLFDEADVFVLPTMSDGFALTQLEAMAHGLPVIATPRCGNVITEGVDGLIIPAGDSGALAAAIVKLDQDRQLASELSRHAPAKAAKFTLEACADAIEAVAHP
jgi:glycosyltransferase involved in cell wall biosynthesis